MAVIRYVIVDDHKIFRKGLRLALADDHRLKCTGEASDGVELLQLLEKQTPDVLLLDLSMPGMGGKESLSLVRSAHPTIKVLILTMYDEDQFILDLMGAGANGYLLKNAEPDDIVLAMRTVYENDFYFSDLVSATLLRKIMTKTTVTSRMAEPAKLNRNETEVLRLICAEHTAAEIAREIHLSQRTIEGIRSALLEKTGARNTAGLVVYAVKNKIVA